jgi:hypothetical protein
MSIEDYLKRSAEANEKLVVEIAKLTKILAGDIPKPATVEDKPTIDIPKTATVKATPTIDIPKPTTVKATPTIDIPKPATVEDKPTIDIPKPATVEDKPTITCEASNPDQLNEILINEVRRLGRKEEIIDLMKNDFNIVSITALEKTKYQELIDAVRELKP